MSWWPTNHEQPLVPLLADVERHTTYNGQRQAFTIWPAIIKYFEYSLSKVNKILSEDLSLLGETPANFACQLLPTSTCSLPFSNTFETTLILIRMKSLARSVLLCPLVILNGNHGKLLNHYRSKISFEQVRRRSVFLYLYNHY